ncbi:TMEM53 family protein [bacterium]|nr:TMEM53 family protein [bacterium]
MASTRFALDVPARFATAGALAPDVPLCLVFGWVNARDAHVKKYTDALTRELECCATVRATMPTARAFSPLERSRVAYVTEALTFARRAYGGRTPRKVYLFCFSNGGCWVQATLARARAEGTIARELMFDFEGVIFDSCPAFMSMKSGGDALTAVMRQPLALVVRLTFYALVSALAIAHLITGTYDQMLTRKFWTTMLNMPNEKKELYIYSLNDRLTDSQKLEALIAHRAKNSANVKVLCFERSPHCAHLRAHPEEYVKALREFIV